MLSLRLAALALILLSGCGSSNLCLNVVCENNRVCDTSTGACYRADAGIGLP